MADQFRKKPVVIEAMQWDGTIASFEVIRDWAAKSNTILLSDDGAYLVVATLEDGGGTAPKAVHTADQYDWIIRGVKGEFYPCKPHIFAATYEPASAPLTPPAAGEGETHEIAQHFIIAARENAVPAIDAEDLSALAEAYLRAAAPRERAADGVSMIAAERARQIEHHGFDAARDNTYDRGELAAAATHYALTEWDYSMHGDAFWPAEWSASWDHKGEDDRITQLTKAGALIAAEIDRLLRATTRREVVETEERGQ